MIRYFVLRVAALAAIGLISSAGTLSAQETKAEPTPATSASVVIVNGLVHREAGGSGEPGEVLVQGGKIAEVGKKVARPSGATIVDAGGRRIVPAFWDGGQSHLLSAEVRAAGPLGSDQQLADSLLRLDARPWHQLLASGVGGAYVDLVPTERGGRGPTGVSLLVDPLNSSADELDKVAGVSFRLGGTTRGESSPTIRAASMRNVTGALDSAKRYKKTWDKHRDAMKEYEKKLAKWKEEKKSGKGKKKEAPKKKEKKPEVKKPAPARTRRRGLPKRPDDWKDWPPEKKRKWFREQLANRRSRNSGPPAASVAASPSKPGKDGRPKPPFAPAKDAGSEAMLRVLDGDVPIRIMAHWKEDILAAIKTAKARKVSLVLLGATEAWRCTKEIKESQALVVVGPAIPLGARSLDTIKARHDLARILVEADIPVAFMTAGATGYAGPSLPLVAALAISGGMTEEAALKALTVNGAAAAGLKGKAGELKIGQLAALQIIDGDVLSPDSRVWRMIIGDRVYDPKGVR